MHKPYSEPPLMVSPELAKQYGLEEALLLGVYLNLLNYVGQSTGAQGVHMLLTRSQWLKLVSFWDEAKLAEVTRKLVEQRVLIVEYRGNEVYVRHEFASLAPTEAQEPVRSLPVRETPPSMPSKRFGPMRTGKDELQQIFEQTEIEKQQRHPMTLEWQPSPQFYQLLKRFNIDPQFANEQLDEFTLYWSSRDRKETNWDQRFLSWVKKADAYKQDSLGRQGHSENHSSASGQHYENARRDSRENRKRVTQAIMDIKDTDW